MGDTWYFAGLNANGVIPIGSQQGGHPDIRRFMPIPELTPDLDEDVDVVFACFSQVVFRVGDRLVLRGFRAGSIDGVAASTITSIVGDHNGITGALDENGKLYLADTEALRDASASLELPLVTHDDSPRLAKVSVAGNFKVAVTFKPAPAASTIHIEEFKDLSSFRKWYDDPSNPDNYPVKHHHISGRIRQLISNTSIFICLNEAGQLYTWGDPRYRGLGRSTNQPGDKPADQPGLLESLDGVKITKISAGGQMFAALSEDKAVYIWTAMTPGNSNALTVHHGLGPGQMALVDIRDENGEPRDFDDIAVGNGHILLRSSDGKVFGAGDNTNGQLGLHSNQDYHPEWTQVVSGNCSSIRVGSKLSIIKVSAPPT
ncbi:Protein FMP25, mitochondrial [Elsinoe australis]|uniref:Protein FMP25, mitochondrial n=1 Tax=Elsinoe australis TaxID=40998 RepID=A0A2P7YW81_9PEZI|nr:Protein FMP25, mitochondrial [Elsinoe australis]